MNCIAQRRPKEIVTLVSGIIAVLPLLNYIRGFITQSLALDLLIFYAPLMVLLLFLPNPHIAPATPTLSRSPGWDELKPAIPALILALYAFIRSGGNYTSAIMFALVVVYLIATLSGFFDMRQIFKIIIFVSCVASILVIVQTISYYLFGKYLQMVWLDICRYDIIATYSAKIISGPYYAGSSLFRPSAFFLEPSHFAQYTVIGMADLLFSTRPIRNRWGKLILISLGLICTTSGMGVMILIYEFVMYAVLQMKGSFRTKSLRVIGYCLLAAGIFAALMQISMFHLTIQRLFGQVDGYNAIAGRTGGWNYIKNMSGTELLFGRGMNSASELIYWVTGSTYLIYTLGIIGAILFAVMIALGMVKSNTRSFIIGCYYLLICFFSATNVGVAVIFHVIIIYSGRLRVIPDT